MMHYELIFYGDDDTTPLFSVGTNPDHERPYLTLGEISPSSIDLLNGTAHIGFGSASVVDPQSGSTQDVRAITALIGTAEGYSAVNRRRFVLRTDPGADVVMNGIISGVTLNPSRAGFTFSFADIRDRGVKVPAFNRTTTCSILPRGVVDGYGLLPNGEWMSPPVTPLRGRYSGNVDSGYIDINMSVGVRSLAGFVDPNVIVSPAALNVVTPNGEGIHDRIQIRWRLAAGGDWNVLENMPVNTYYKIPLVNRLYPRDLLMTGKGRVNGLGGEMVEVNAVRRIYINNSGGGTLPANNADVEFMVIYAGPPTEDYPLHIEGPWGGETVVVL